MIDPGDFADCRVAKGFLSDLGRRPDDELPLAEGALALAALDAPVGSVAYYHHHLGALADAVAEAARGATTLAARIAALNDVLYRRYGYAGDTLTYDDPQNANLMRVIDRRKGLPVALGILAIHVARAQGWEMRGLALPGHFLVRIAQGGERVILDPFNGGCARDAAALRELLRAISGSAVTLSPEHYAPVSDRDVLLRLQNNLKLRHIERGEPARALAVLDQMRLFAPNVARLWYEAGALQAELGNFRAAAETLERALTLSAHDGERRSVALLLQRLRLRLN